MMRTLLLIMFSILFLTASSTAGGQEKDEKVKGKHRRIVEEAEFFYSLDDHFMARRIYADLIDLYPENAEFNFRLGFSYLHLRNEEKLAIPYLQKAAELGYTPASYFLAEAYHLDEQFFRALIALEEYRSKPDHKLTHARIDIAQKRIEKAMTMMNDPIEVKIERLGSNVNSDYQDYAPNIDAEGEYLYFTSRRPESTGGYTDQEGNYFEDIFYCKNVADAWTKAEPMPRPVNEDGHDANVNFAASGNSMLIYRTHKNLYSGDLYITNRIREGWSEPEKLEASINTTEYHEPSAAFSPDEKEIYVVSDRPGGFGGKDIYVIRKLPNGNWSEPQNLGREINTAFDEDAPFLSLDGQNFFFSSMGNGSIGGYDVFRCSKNETGEWGSPDHLGYPINSVYDDIYFSVTANGKRAFLSSSREKTMDIYEIEMLYEYDDLVVVKGLLTDELNQIPLIGEVTFEDIREKKNAVTVVTNKLSGKFVAAVMPDREYKITVNCAGYAVHEDTIEVRVNSKGDFEVLEYNVRMKEE
ncbi:MAG: hypothetical protein HKN45_06720 [Flavobacteriales bacterium]|nr:hypothetical protein [Flavobacteriales bacterium]